MGREENATQVMPSMPERIEPARTIFGSPDSDVASPDVGDFAGLMDATIMMVDDEPLNIEVIQTFLEDAGYKSFLTTSQSTEALELMEANRPDVVLLDLMMPDVTGFDILKVVRLDKDLKHIPVIVLTSATDADTKLKALELGASDFLAKPVDPSELALRLRNTLAAKAYQDQLAYYDGLTALPNRRMLLERLGWAVDDAKREGTYVAVLHIGLDRFSQINDTLGLAAGDELLKVVARRLRPPVTAADSPGRAGESTIWRNASRLGGDEFSIVLPDIVNAEGAIIVARRILEIISEPADIEEHEVTVTASIGIAVSPDDGEEIETLLRHASIASDHARQHGGNTYQFYSREFNARSAQRLKLENELRKALERDEFILLYQPKLDLRKGNVPGAEVLLRWQHPELGTVSPAEFIPVAEETGLIVPIGEWILREACRQNVAWQAAGLGGFAVAVNVATHQFSQSEFVNTVRDVLEKSKLAPQFLTLELTESIIMEDAKKNVDTLHHLKEMGLRISVDDFGTGYSSLSYLKRFPLDELKIDRSFIADLSVDTDDAAIVTAIIVMAQTLGLKVVAEGVEQRHQYSFLKQKGCDQCQGVLISKPLTANELSARIKKAAPAAGGSARGGATA